jgi:hypothetical protein
VTDLFVLWQSFGSFGHRELGGGGQGSGLERPEEEVFQVGCGRGDDDDADALEESRRRCE